MTAEGPTTAGSIEAKLKIDDSDWMAKLAAADAAARRLGQVDPHIDIHVDDNGAVTKLTAVDEAAKALGDTNGKLDLSQKALNNTNGAGVGQWQAIGIAIAALIPLLGPLLAATVGLAGGLAGMGAAGVLAVFGIIQAMKQGSVVGQQYTQGLGALKDEFDQLASTAAAAVLHDFQNASDLVAAAMPTLNTQIAQFAAILGGAATDAVDGTINAFEVLNPLFVEGAKVIADIADGFNQWTQNGGLQKFTTYAVRELPQVMRTISLLSDVLVKFTTELTPAGDGMLAVLADAALLLKGLQNLQDGLDGMTKSWIKANNDFKGNPILAGLVQTAMEALNPLQTFGDKIGGIGNVITSLGPASSTAATKIHAGTQSIGDLAKATDTAKTALDKFNQALQGLGQTNLSASQANIQYQQSLADTTAAIQTNGATLDLSTQKGRDNMSALDGIASSAVSLIAAQQKAGASADSLSGQMASARTQFINAAMAAGDSRDAASKLADQYGLIPKDVSTAFVTSGADAAIAAALAIKAAYDNINRQITIRVNSIISNAASNPNGMGLGSGGNGHAYGGTIRGPGGPKSDRVPIWASPGEEMIQNPYAGAWRPALKLMNAGAPKMQVAAAVSRIAGGSQKASVAQVTNNHYWTINEATNGVQLAQQVANRQNARSAV